jgi:tRNA nucleotidyltransferase (CCA-adding enzyme)
MAARIERLLASGVALTVRDLAVDGGDVMRALGVPPGPAVGEALESLLEVVLDDPTSNERETLLARLRERRTDANGRGSEA